MDANPVEQALKELLPYLEDMETRSQAILQLLRDRERVSDEQLAPYLEQASRISNVKWRAARVRMEHLLSAASNKSDEQPREKPAEPKAEPSQEESADKKPESKPDTSAERSPQEDAA